MDFCHCRGSLYRASVNAKRHIPGWCKQAENHRTGVEADVVKGAVEVWQVGADVRFEQPPHAEVGCKPGLLQERQHLGPEPRYVVAQCSSRHSHQRLGQKECMHATSATVSLHPLSRQPGDAAVAVQAEHGTSVT